MTLGEALSALGAGKAICHETWDTDEWLRLTDDGLEWSDGSSLLLVPEYLVGWRIFETPLTAQETLDELRTIIAAGWDHNRILRLLWPSNPELWKR